MGRRASYIWCGLLGLLLFQGGVQAGTQAGDPHRSESGFFDIHVCNWPEKPLFFLALFSTAHFDKVDGVDIIYPDGRVVGSLDMEKFMRFKARKNRPEKRVFISHFDVPEGSPDGWYQARVRLKGGNDEQARDYVVIEALPQADGLVPAHEALVPPGDIKLSWNPVPGAEYYQIYIRDLWQGEKIVHRSKLLKTNQYAVPADVLEAEGMYSWKVHARDLNEHVLLGDFNHGSQSKWITLEIDSE